jgi:hypothetical protein
MSLLTSRVIWSTLCRPMRSSIWSSAVGTKSPLPDPDDTLLIGMKTRPSFTRLKDQNGMRSFVLKWSFEKSIA